VKSEALVNALAETVEEKQAETLIEPVANMKADSSKGGESEAKRLFNALSNTLPDVPDVKAERLVDALANKGRARDTKRNLPNVKAEKLVDALADSLAEVEIGKLTDTLVEVKEEAETLIYSLVNVKAKALVGALAKTIRDEEAKSLIDTRVKVTAEALGDDLDGTQSEVEPETLSTTLVELKTLAHVDALVDTL